MKPNPSKTQVCAFHFINQQASRKLQVIWEGKKLEPCFTPKYFGVTLDQSLTYRTHCLNTKRKVSARSNILQKLSSTYFKNISYSQHHQETRPHNSPCQVIVTWHGLLWEYATEYAFPGADLVMPNEWMSP